VTQTAWLLLPVALLALAAPAVASTHVVGTDRDERLVGTSSGDWIDARQGDDEVLGLAGNDILGGDAGKDVVRGGPGNDDLNGGPGGDRLSGGPGKDSLEGDQGRDVLRGGPGNDFLADYDDGDLLLAGAGNDHAGVASNDPGQQAVTRLHLGTGNDEVIVQDDDRVDLVDCGPGDDVAEWVTTLDPNDQYVGCEVVREYLGY
jgi:Ca2+-binding RTX toxin-like protein